MKGEFNEESLNQIIKLLVVAVVIIALLAGIKMSGAFEIITGTNEGTGIHGNSNGNFENSSTHENTSKSSKNNNKLSTVEITEPFEPEPEYPPTDNSSVIHTCYDYQMNATPIFNNKYELAYNTVSFKVDVLKAPFVIDCNMSPRIKDISIPFMDISVNRMENRSQVVEEERWFGLDLENDKQLIIREPGIFYVDIYGNQVTLNLTISTGA